MRRQKLCFFLFLLVGLGLLNYPFISQWVNQKNQSKVIYEYEKKTAELPDAEKEELLAEAGKYNQKLLEQEPVLRDGFAATEEGEGYKEYQKLLNPSGDGILCYLEIPSIKVFLPVFHGTSEHVLEQGAGHLYGSSLPVGGAGTHTVIAAHTGIATKMFFTDLDQLTEGEFFFLNLLGEKLAYQIDRICVVTPDRTDLLQIENGKDYVTLVTCTPYGINSHRLLVRGVRASYQEAEKKSEHTVKTGFLFLGKKVFVFSVLFLGATGLWLFVPFKGRRKRVEGKK